MTTEQALSYQISHDLMLVFDQQKARYVHSLLDLAIKVVPIGRVVGASDFDLLDVGVDDFVVVAERFDEE